MLVLSKVAAPAVWLLNASTSLIFSLLGTKSDDSSTVTEEEIKMLVGEAESAGVIEEEERRMISGVLRLGDRTVRGLMTPRTDVDWIDLDDGEEAIRELLIEHPAFAPAGQRGHARQRDRRRAVARASRGHAVRPAARHPQAMSSRRRSSRIRSMPWMRWRSCATRRCRWRWSMTNTGISRGS